MTKNLPWTLTLKDSFLKQMLRMPGMRAILYKARRLSCVNDRPIPELRPGWALIQVVKAGICATDMEIIRGYGGFQGILGHEFVGVVHSAMPTEGAPDLTGRRVVGEINVGCGRCDWCRRGMERHCPERVALGIRGLDGCMADYCVLPLANLRPVPGDMTNETAVWTEPLSAALEILDQINGTRYEKAAVLGDGRIGILCAWVLLTVVPEVTLIGRHREKLEKARWRGLNIRVGFSKDMARCFDMVVEATGSETGLSHAVTLCRPRGTIVLKSTIATEIRVDLSRVVVNEQTIIGSRCGRFDAGLEMLVSHPDMPLERLISDQYPIEDGLKAFERAGQPGVLKVLIDMGMKP